MYTCARKLRFTLINVYTILMKELVVISGKGGTGKTSLVASFATLVKDKIMVDCDVDAADLHLILRPEIEKTQGFEGSKLAVKDDEKCVECGECQRRCRFGAIDEGLNIDPFSCEGCAVCAYVCPVDAIEMKPRLSGYAYISSTDYGTMAHAELEPGEGTSGKLVMLVRQNASQLARLEGQELIIIDGSPGIGCPVIASISGATAALIVTEPTLSGIHDLERVLGVARHFRTKPFICINKYDLSEEMTRRIEDYAQREGIEVVGEIPYDDIVTEAMVHERSVVDYSDGRVAQEIRKMWVRLEAELGIKSASHNIIEVKEVESQDFKVS